MQGIWVLLGIVLILMGLEMLFRGERSWGASQFSEYYLCIWEGLGWLRARCAKKHKCGVEMPLPVVNSLRVGMCGHTGGAGWD